jgi:hypothetical protein
MGFVEGLKVEDVAESSAKGELEFKKRATCSVVDNSAPCLDVSGVGGIAEGVTQAGEPLISRSAIPLAKNWELLSTVPFLASGSIAVVGETARDAAARSAREAISTLTEGTTTILSGVSTFFNSRLLRLEFTPSAVSLDCLRCFASNCSTTC